MTKPPSAHDKIFLTLRCLFFSCVLVAKGQLGAHKKMWLIHCHTEKTQSLYNKNGGIAG